VFDKDKVITPDICFYNNFVHDASGEFYSLNSTYVMFSDELPSEYLVGVLNSNAVQFYMRRTAPQYGNDYLRYITSYLFEIPIPDPNESGHQELVETVVKCADELRQLGERYRRSNDLLETPSIVYGRDAENIELSSLSFAEYIDTMDFDGEGEVSPVHNGNEVRLNIQDTISFVSEETAEAFTKLLSIFEVESIDVLTDMEVPSSADGLWTVVEAFREAEESVTSDPEAAVEVEAELNHTVYELYGFDEEYRDLIEERVDKPENLLEAKVRT